MKAKLSASKMFVPARLKMSPEYEAQVKHFKEVTTHKILAKYGVGIGVKEQARKQLPASLRPVTIKVAPKFKTAQTYNPREPKISKEQQKMIAKINRDLNLA